MRPRTKAYFECLQGVHSAMAEAIEDLPPEALDWEPGEEMNSICVLVTHTAGAERFLAGDVAMEDPGQRDRPEEFRASGLDAETLIQRLAQSEAYIESVLERLSPEEWEAPRTMRDGTERSVSWALYHLLDHTAQHSGHVQMTRQLWEQRGATGSGSATA